jgi:two-component system CheB/CheR fusion protein
MHRLGAAQAAAALPFVVSCRHALGRSGLYSTFGVLTDVFRSAQSAMSPAGGERLMKKTRAGRAVSPATTDGTADTRNESRARRPFPIVGVGASAGGLEAFSSLLKHLPLDTGMGFVLVQHLDPEHDSALTQLLGRATLLPVTEVTNNLRVEPNHVYVIPPNTNLSIADGVLTLGPRPKTRTPHRSIDFFFEALAKDQRDCAIGVILSGTATDGTRGLEAIKAEGGITFAQDDSARYDSMPRSAAASGSVDFILSPEDIATELARIAKHPAVAGAPTGSAEDRASATAPEDDEAPLASGGRGTPRTGATRARAEADTPETIGTSTEDGFKKILLLLRNSSSVDFSLYKSSTIQRRIIRRMVLTKHHTLERYAQFLRGNSRELGALYSDVLISVTSFFRNPDAFDVLRRKVWPALLAQRGDEPLRVWTLGCSTGQEAYSLAMSFVEAADRAPRLRKLQVFATDLNDALLDKARHGLYAKSIAQDLSPERLRRFFVEEEGGYRVSKALREMIVFARQNVMSDPPFSRLDIISCRNLLIYFEPALQKKVFPIFHYALKPGGFLYLGASESIGGFTELFEPLDKKHRIYAKKAAATPAFRLPASKHRDDASNLSRQNRGTPPRHADQGAAEGFRGELSAQREADRVSVNQFAPPAVLINADLQILQFRGPTGAYLEPPTGKASFDVLKMARTGLMMPLRSAINKAKKENTTARKEHVRIEEDGKARVVNIEVIPLKNLRDRCFLVVFEDAAKAGAAAATSRGTRRLVEAPRARVDRGPRAAESRRIAALEAELAETRDYVQSIQEQHEAANEELQASNEEVQSANEELQSVNEELETSKEELESANEELTTLNEEMANRNSELNRLNSDLVNIQTSAQLAIVLLGRDLTIRRFSVPAAKQLNLLASDVGRPVSHVRHNLELSDLELLITEVIDSVRAREREVQDKDGRWFSLRVRPYLTADNTVDGAVLVLVDINDLKRAEIAIASAREYAENIIGTMREPLVVLDPDLRVESVNRAFYRTFGVTPGDTIGKFIYELGNRQWDIPEFRALLEEILPQSHTIEDFLVECDFEHLGRRSMLLNARRMHSPGGLHGRIVVAIEDITERKQTEGKLRDSEQRFTRFMQHLPGLGWIKDADGHYVYANDAAEKAFRTPRTELYGKSDQDLFPQATAARFAANDRRALDESSIQAIETLEDEAGIVHQSIVSKFSIPGSNGDANLVGGVAIDSTELKEAEEALRDSEERYRTLFASIDEGFCIIEKVEGPLDAPLDFRYVEANPAFAAQSGVNGVIGKTIRQAFPGEPEEWFQTYDLVLRTGEPMRFERGLVTQGRVLELYAFRIEDYSQRRVAVLFKDITARKRAEEAQARLAAIVASSDDAIISKDLNGVITSWNNGAERLFGYSAQEAIGQPITLLIPPDRFDEESGILERIRRGEGVDHFETVRRRKDGTLVDVSVAVSPIRDSEGTVVGASKIARDITEGKTVEAAVRDSEERYRTLFDLGPVAVYSCDAAGVIQTFNRRAAELWGREPVPGDTDQRFCGSFKMFRPDGRYMPHEQCPMAEVVAGTLSEVRDAEVHIERPDGTRVTVVVNIRPLKNHHGEITGAINCFYDITERKHAEEAVRESDRRKTEFLAMLAHELRNPLAPILVSIEILRRAKGGERSDLQSSQWRADRLATTNELSDRIDYALDVLQRQVGQMVRLVDDLLDAGRISRGKIDLRRERVELSSVVYHVVDAARPISERRDQELTVALPSAPVYVDADPTRLGQIVGNLLNNACKFTERGGHIWLTVEREEDSGADRAEGASIRVARHVAIRVRDTGIGIAADQLERVFDMFTQVDTSLERSVNGLGIGLTLVKTLTEMHGGSVEVRSDGAGQGSEFVVRLPMAVETDSTASRPMAAQAVAATPLRVLIVDDNHDSADMLAILLQFAGHETFAAHDGLAAVEAAATLDPDVILLDIGLPLLNGYEAARRIREQQGEKRRPLLVALTGWGQDEDRRRSEEAGFDAHLVKPVDVAILGKLLAELSAGKQEVRH